MVNFPNSAASQNASLERRLAASNQHIQEMLEEHQQIVQEMNVLRGQAEQLAQLNAARISYQNQIDEVESSVPDVDHNSDIEDDNDDDGANANVGLVSENLVSDEHKTADNTNNDENVENSQKLEDGGNTIDDDPNNLATAKDQSIEEDDKTTSETNEQTQASTSANTNIDDDTESLIYIQSKIAEIAKLKEQFKRVQNMIDTTKVIEEHLASKGVGVSETNASTTCASDVAVPVETQPNPTSDGESAHATNEHVLLSMLNGFTEFNMDLRNQVQALREERERIRAFKEDLISRKRQS